MADLVAQLTVTRPPGPREWILDAQRRQDAGDVSDSDRPWAERGRARLAVLRAFRSALPDDRPLHEGELSRGGVVLLQAGTAFSPVPEWKRVLLALADSVEAAQPSLRRVMEAADEVNELARKENQVRPSLGSRWVVLVSGAHSLHSFAFELLETIQQSLRIVEESPSPALPGAPPNARAATTAACARLKAMATNIQPLTSVLGPAVLMLLEIAFELAEPFDEPSGENDTGSSGEYKRRMKRISKVWSDAKPA